MIKLLTSNIKKYQGFESILEELRIQLEISQEPLLEIQSDSFIECVRYKASSAALKYGEPVLVDDAGIILDEYANFPGPMTKLVLKQLGISGLKRLVGDTSCKARMVCVIGISVNGNFRYWLSEVSGSLDFQILVSNPEMLLSDIFVPDTHRTVTFAHRHLAFEALKKDIFKIHLSIDDMRYKESVVCTTEDDFCPFCIEFSGTFESFFKILVENRLQNRTLYEDDDFIVIIPMGQFMVGGMLLLTKKHIRSFAYLEPKLYEKLQILVDKIKISIKKILGVRPLIFEHGSAIDENKGVCCVDHAHLNIFPANVSIHYHLKTKMFFDISSVSELQQLKNFSEGYLYVDSSLNGHKIYDGYDVGSQLIRKIITKELGFEDRWHWRDYLGIEEMIETMEKFSDTIR